MEQIKVYKGLTKRQQKDVIRNLENKLMFARSEKEFDKIEKLLIKLTQIEV